jgi:hypothetical protein
VWTALVNWAYALADVDASLTILTRALDPQTLRDPSLRVPEILDFARARRDRVRVVMRAHPTDDDVRTFMREVDVLMLPYTFGTHSGQLELAYDTGSLALASDVGHLREQAAVTRWDGVEWFTWSDGVEPLYGRRFVEALARVDARARAGWDADPTAVGAFRAAEHEQLLRAYSEIYARPPM